MVNKIRYPRTALEICDVTLDVLRRGMLLRFSGKYPEIDCYNGRRWSEGAKNQSLYYIRTAFQASIANSKDSPGIEAFDVRMAILRNSIDYLNEGMPFFWCAVWYRVGAVTCSRPPSQYHPDIHRKHYHCPRWGILPNDSVVEFDPVYDFPELGMLYALKPPHPIQF